MAVIDITEALAKLADPKLYPIYMPIDGEPYLVFGDIKENTGYALVGFWLLRCEWELLHRAKTYPRIQVFTGQGRKVPVPTKRILEAIDERLLKTIF